MQGGYEPRGSRGSSRGVYLVRRAIFIAIVIVLVAFVLPRACGAFSDPNATDSASGPSKPEGKSNVSGGSGGSGGETENAAEGSGSTETASGTTAGGEVDPTGSTEGSGDDSDAGEEAGDDGDGRPDTVEETLAVEEPEETEAAAPTGIPTLDLSEDRARKAQREEDALASRLEPPMTPLAALPLLPKPEPPAEAPAPNRDQPVREAPEAGPAAQELAITQQEVVVVTQPAVAEPTTRRRGVRASVTRAVEPVAEITANGRRVARAGNNVAYTSGGGEDGGRAARTVADARRSLNAITPAGGVRAAVRGALRDAGAAVTVAESLDARATGSNKRCAKNPRRCASALLR